MLRVDADELDVRRPVAVAAALVRQRRRAYAAAEPDAPRDVRSGAHRSRATQRRVLRRLRSRCRPNPTSAADPATTPAAIATAASSTCQARPRWVNRRALLTSARRRPRSPEVTAVSGSVGSGVPVLILETVGRIDGRDAQGPGRVRVSLSTRRSRTACRSRRAADAPRATRRPWPLNRS